MSKLVKLVILLFCAFIATDLIYSQSAHGADQVLTNQDKLEIMRRLDQMKESISSLDDEISSIPNKQKLLELKENYIESSNNIYSSFMTNFLAALGIVLAIIGVAGVFITKIVTERAVKAAAYTNLSHCYFTMNDPDISEIIKHDFSNLGQSQAEKVLEHSYLGWRFAFAGLSMADRDTSALQSDSRYEESHDSKMARFRINLLNNLIFSKALVLVAQKSLNKDICHEEVGSLIEKAEECRILINSVDHDQQWYEIYDSVIFVFIKVGDDILQSRGRKLADDICNQNWKPTPKHCDVPIERKRVFEADYLS